MRMYFLLLFTVCTCLLQAQPARVVTTQELLKKYRQSTQKQALNQPPIKDLTTFNLLLRYRAHARPGIYRLRGGMPCIVPDTKDIAAIPNAWPALQKLPYPATIPNSGKGLYPVLPQLAPQKDLKKGQ